MLHKFSTTSHKLLFHSWALGVGTVGTKSCSRFIFLNRQEIVTTVVMLVVYDSWMMETKPILSKFVRIGHFKLHHNCISLLLSQLSIPEKNCN